MALLIWLVGAGHYFVLPGHSVFYLCFPFPSGFS